MKKRVLSFLLVLSMLLSMLPAFGVFAQDAGSLDSGDDLSKNENSDAPSKFYDLYVTDGLVAFYDAFDTASDVLDLENGKWYAKLYNATTGEFEKTTDDAYTAVIGGGVYSENAEAPNLTGWVKGEKGFSYFTNQSVGANKISFPVTLISSLEKYGVEFVGRVDLREVHDARQENGAVEKVSADGKTTYKISGLTVLTYNNGQSYCTNRAYYTITLKGEANAEVALVINESPVKVTLDENGNYTYMEACAAKLDTYTIVAPEDVTLTFSKDATLNAQLMSNSAFVFGTLHGTHWTNKLGDNNWGNGKGNSRWYTGSADWGVHNGNGSNSAYGGSMKDMAFFKNYDGKIETLRVDATKTAASENYTVSYGTLSTSVSGNKHYDDYKFDVLSNTCGAALALRLYNRHLTAAEKKMNTFVDKMIYNGVDFDAYNALADNLKEMYRTSTEALAIDAGHDVYAAALENVQEFAKQEAAMRAMSYYDELYVGANGEGNSHLVALFSAYGSDTISVDFANRAWRDKVGKNDIVFQGALYDAETKAGYWKLRENGGVGYDMNFDETGKNGTYNSDSGVYMQLNPTLLASDFTVEYAVAYEYFTLLDGTIYTTQKSITYNETPTDMIGILKNMTCRTGSFTTGEPNRVLRWYVVEPSVGWQQSGFNGQLWGDNSRGDDSVFVQSITRDEVELADDEVQATYQIHKDAALRLSGTYSTANTTKGTVYFKNASGQSFYLFRQVPVSVYSIRIYDTVLSAAEMQHNRFIDLAAYCGADLTEYFAMNENQRLLMEGMMAGLAFNADPEVFETAFSEIAKALNSEFDMDTTLYVTDGLEILLTAYESMNTGMVVTDSAITWFNAVEKGTYGVLKGSGWKLNPTGGVTIVKNYDAFMSDRTFGLYFGSEMLPAEDYTVELVANPVGISNDDGTRYIDEITTYGIHYDNGFGIGPLRGLQFYSYRPNGKDGQLEKRWVYQYQNNAWTSSGHKARFQDTSWKNLGLDQVLTYTISLDVEDMTAQYLFYQDSKQIGSFKIGQSDFITNEKANNMFQLMVGVAGTMYACRVYNRTLTETEVMQNHLADLVYFYNIDASFLQGTLKQMDDASAVYNAFKEMGFDLPRAEAQAYFESRLAAIWLTQSDYAVRSDLTDGMRYYFDLNMGGINAMLAAGVGIEIGSIVNIGKDAAPVLDNYGYDYKVVAFDSIAGKYQGFFLDNSDTFAVTVRYQNANKATMLSAISVRGYVKLTYANGSEVIFYASPSNGAPNNLFEAYDGVSESREDVLLEDLGLNDYISAQIAACYDNVYVNLDAAASAGGDGSEEKPFANFNDAFAKCKELMAVIDKPTNLYLLAADGVYGVYDVITLEAAEKPYKHCKFIITSENGKSTLTTSIDIDASEFVSEGGNMYSYQFEADENGNYPGFRYLYVNDAMANLSVSGATRAADIYGIYRTAYEREYDNIYQTAYDLYKRGELTLETMPYDESRTDLVKAFAKYRSQFLALSDVAAVDSSELNEYTAPTQGTADALYAETFEYVKNYYLAWYELRPVFYQYGAASEQFGAFTTAKQKPDKDDVAATEAYNAYVAAFTAVKAYMVANGKVDYPFGDLITPPDSKTIGKIYLNADLLGDLTHMIEEGHVRMDAYADKLEASLNQAVADAQLAYETALLYKDCVVAISDRAAKLNAVNTTAEKLTEAIATNLEKIAEQLAAAEEDLAAKTEAYNAAKAALDAATEENKTELEAALTAAETKLSASAKAYAKIAAVSEAFAEISAVNTTDGQSAVVALIKTYDAEIRPAEAEVSNATTALTNAEKARDAEKDYIAELRDDNLWIRHALTEYKIEMHMAAQWDYNIMHITGVDYADYVENEDGTTHIACYMEMSEYSRFVIPDGYTAKGRYVFLKNIFEFVDSENEYFYDEEIGKLYYYTEGDITDNKYSYPTSDYMFKFYGMTGVTIRDMTFTGVDDNFLSDNGHCGGQSAGDSRFGGFPERSAIYIKNCYGMEISECDFYDLGVEGITARGWIQDLTVDSNTFRNIGAAAIRIGGNTSAWDPDIAGNLRVNITNNYLDNIATEYHQSSALQIASNKDCVLTNNTVKNTSYTAFSIGWRWSTVSWQRGEGINSDNIDISYNYITDFMTELADGGAIYMLGGNATTEDTSYFNFIHHNYIVFSRISGNGLGGMICGIYFDGSCTNWHCYQNVVVEQSYGAVAAEADYEDYGLDADMRDQLIKRRNGSTFIYIQHIPSQLTYNILCENNYVLNVRNTDPDLQLREVYKTYVVASRNIKESGTRYIRDLNRIPSAVEGIIESCGAPDYAADPTILYGNDY